MLYEEEEYLDDDYDDEGPADVQVGIKVPQPHFGQQLVLKSKAKFKILCCGRRWGKSLVSQIIALTAMTKGEKVAYVTPQYGLGKDVYREFTRLIPRAAIRLTNKVDLFIELKTGGSIRFMSGENMDTFRGRSFHKVIIDEAAMISDLETAWNAAISPTLIDYNGDAIFLSTPKGYNYFYSLYLKGQNREKDYESWSFPTSANPHLPKGVVERAKENTTQAEFEQEYLALPSANSGNPFGMENIEKNIITEFSMLPTVVYGVDVAGAGGSDYSVIVGLDMNGVMTSFDRFKLPWELTYEKILALPETVLKVIDQTGIGDVLFERLRNAKSNIKGFKFTAQSKPAIINQLVSEVQKGLVKYNKITAEEMGVFEGNMTSSGYIKYGAMSGYHDDCVCSLAIAVHHKYLAFSASSWQLYRV